MSNTTKNIHDGFFLKIHMAQYLEQVVWSVNGIIHPNWFFFWNPEPGAWIICGDQKFSVTPDYAYLIPPYTTISAASEKPFAHLYAHFDVSEPFSRAANRIYQLSPEPARRFYYEQNSCDVTRKILYWQIMLMEYLAMLPDEAWHKPENLQDARILKVLEYFNDNYLHAPNNTVLAKRANMSVNNFYRRFREMMGISPQRYIVSMRLNAARNMLSAGKTDIEQIARRCGFADRYCFSKAFKQYFGIAPGAFRRQQQKKD